MHEVSEDAEQPSYCSDQEGKILTHLRNKYKLKMAQDSSCSFREARENTLLAEDALELSLGVQVRWDHFLLRTRGLHLGEDLS